MQLVDTGTIYNHGLCQLAGAAEVTASGKVVVAFNRLTDGIEGNVGCVWHGDPKQRRWQDTGHSLRTNLWSRRATHVALGMSEVHGRLLLPWVELDYTDVDEQLHRRHSKALAKPAILYLDESTTDGKTWPKRRTIVPPVSCRSCHPYGKIRAVGDEFIWPVVFNMENNHSRVGFLVSHDNGETWPECRWLSNNVVVNETDWLPLPGGRWVAVCRSLDGELRKAWSANEGRSWTPLQPTQLFGESPSLWQAQNGRIYLAYRKVDVPNQAVQSYGIGISHSDDGGNTWHNESTLEDPKGHRYRASHEAGMPVILPIADNRIMVVFYSFDPSLPYKPEDTIWQEVKHFYKRYIAFNIFDLRS